ncbi:MULTISPECIES: DUF4864 domain-containing protein [unclassified Lentilitoribacter]|jgi:hypothetical protein|uniref:DUF4864 domain-containing protein n=1 Tax=unclassified Lentilitoribacter TaxID=2647570 RepID=UPI0013A6925E|nr:DUF4864 domain-containing protein [Lentilitoribacter sp. Alg239-R112]
MTRQIKTLVACVVLFLSGFVIGATAQNIAKSDTLEVQRVISDQLSAFIKNDGARAYSHAAPSIKKMYPNPTHFMAMVERGYGAIYRSTTYDFGRSKVENGNIYQELILTGERGNTWESIYALSKQDDGSWKIMGVQMRRSENSTL